jgi:hypothetical protein
MSFINCHGSEQLNLYLKKAEPGKTSGKIKNPTPP